MVKALDIPTLISFHLDFARLAKHMNYGPINLGFMEGIADFMTRIVFQPGRLYARAEQANSNRNAQPGH